MKMIIIIIILHSNHPFAPNITLPYVYLSNMKRFLDSGVICPVRSKDVSISLHMHIWAVNQMPRKSSFKLLTLPKWTILLFVVTDFSFFLMRQFEMEIDGLAGSYKGSRGLHGIQMQKVMALGGALWVSQSDIFFHLRKYLPALGNRNHTRVLKSVQFEFLKCTANIHYCQHGQL